MAPPLRLVAYRCPFCNASSQVNEAELDGRKHYANELRAVGSFTCVFDERLICKECCPKPAPGEDDLRRHREQHSYRVEVTHARTPLRRVIWLSEMDLQGLESTLRGRKDAEYLKPGKSAGKPNLATWWRSVRAELDSPEPDLGDELGMWPRHIDFGKLDRDPVSRPLHLLNPTDRPAVFQLTSNITTSGPPGPPRPPHFAYRVDCTPAIEAARRAYDSFEVPPRSRLVIDVVAEPWARDDHFRRFEIWVTPQGQPKQYLGEVTYIHKP